ncbi:MAG: PAS domain-containing protein, partial [Myxococcales bacterium]|nr:PAS domain-containing protein [Myxococcales bacterium]
PDTILVMDRRGRVEFCNHFSEVGEPEQLLGEGFEELLEPEHKQLWRTAITKVAMQARVQEVEVAIVARNGTRHDYLVRVAPVDADRGRLLAIVTEISERR